MAHQDKSIKYKYPYRYCDQKKLCQDHGLNYKTVERWISEAKDRGETIPGRIKIPGVRNYIFDPIVFHDEFLMPKLLGPTRNEHEKAHHVVILNNLKQKRAN